MRAFFVAVAIIAVANTVFAEEIGDELEAAKARWKEATAVAAKALESEINATIDRLAKTSDLEAVRVVRDEAKAFAEDGQIPSSAFLQEPATVYRQARKKEGDKLIKGYQKAIAEYTKAKLFDQAEAVDADLAKFTEAEQAAIETQSSAGGSSKVEKSMQILGEFSERFSAQHSLVQMEATTAKREVAHASMMKKLDQELRSKNVTMRFPVRDIQDGQNKGKYDFSLESPEGIEQIDGATNHLTRITGVQLAKDVALKTKPGDVIVVSGTPRFGMDRYTPRNGAIAILEFRPDRATSETYCIFLQSFKVAIDHSK